MILFLPQKLYELAHFTVSNVQLKVPRLHAEPAVRIHLLLKGVKAEQIMMMPLHTPM